MSPEGTKRKLAAIFSADVKGYSRLMEDDEEATVATLTSHRKVMTKVIEKHNGRVVDSPGDNLLAEFASVVDAMRGAVEVQEELRARNSELPDHRRMEYRIGINLGDVIEEDGRLYGDGVNIAARVESLADAGGICVSGSAYEQIRNKLSLGIDYLGEHEVKNISVPVPVYRLVMEPGAAGARVRQAKGTTPSRWKKWAVPAIPAVIVAVVGMALWQLYLRPKHPPIEPASVERMAFPLPEKPSIAVLPFTNMSGDPEQEYIADGISENIITALSKVPEMFVIARNSTFTYKGKPVKVQQVAEELGVRYVLEGSVQKEGDRVRITTQLIDAVEGHHLWAERYDRDLQGFFELLDEITKKIGAALQVEMTWGEEARYIACTDDFEAWGYITKSYSHFLRMTQEDNAKARGLAEQAINLDPESGCAWLLSAGTHLVDAQHGFSESRAESFKRGVEMADTAVEKAEANPAVHILLAFIHLFQGQHDEAIAEGEKAIALNPNFALGYRELGLFLYWAGRPEEAIELSKKALRLSPNYPTLYLTPLAWSYAMAGRYDEAIATNQLILDRWKKEGGNVPREILAHVRLAEVYAELGQEENARAHAAQVLEMNPKFSLEQWQKIHSYKDPAHLDRRLQALRKAGLPETPPLPLPDKPSIAVLPFANISGDPEQEYFADGMTDDLITDLSKISGLFVIARTSAFGYKGKTPKVQEVGRDLGVRYVLEGSVRRVGDQVRINAQLIDAKTGGHLWAERYDSNMGDIFALQDKINQKIIAALAVKLAGDERLRGASGTDNVAAYEAFLKGRHHHLRFTPGDFTDAIRYFKRAVELDPNYGEAYAGLANTFWWGSTRRWHLGVAWAEARLLGRAYLETAMKSPSSLAHQLAAWISGELRLHEKAVSEAERGIALDPNDPGAHIVLGWALTSAGRPHDAVAFLERAMRLDPLNIAPALSYLGRAQFCMGQYEKAVNSLESALADNPYLRGARLFLASAYAHLGRDQEAHAELDDFSQRVSLGWKMGLRGVMSTFTFDDLQVAGRFAEGLLKAGLPGEPNGYGKIREENRLTGTEIKDLVFGKTINVTSVWGDSERIERNKDGKCTVTGWDQVEGRIDEEGRSWIEGDTLCNQWPGRFGGHKMCATVFRNPEGTSDETEKYFMVSDLHLSAFLLEE